jgi:DNA-directed RNA polymerase sigma subunit (sigma70/sigma32)
VGMASLVRRRQIVCHYCGEECGDIRRLGVHLLDEHASNDQPVPEAIDRTLGLDATSRELLSKDAEEALGRLIQDNGPRAIEARNFLVESNLRLVVSLVMKLRQPLSRVPDLIQEGNIGLMRAAELFDPSRGFRFSTYAVWWIRQTIQRGKSKHDIVATPDGSKYKLSKARRLLAQGSTPEAVAAELGLTPGSLRAALTATSARTISLDQGGPE